MKKGWFIACILASCVLLLGFSGEDIYTVGKETPVRQVLDYFGESPAAHDLEDITEEQVEQGRQLVFEGRTKSSTGKKSRLQSKHFKCISCHNMEREQADLTSSDSQDILDYAVEKNLPLLQGSSLFGVVNRETFYNGDYQKKYAGNPRIRKANKDIREAIQLCAVECAQGRPFKKWELEAVLAYLWSLEMKLGDLDLSDADYGMLRKAGGENSPEGKRKIIDFVKSKYALSAPATFGRTPGDATQGYEGITGNPENGKEVYERGCLYCHGGKKYSFYELDKDKMTFQHLQRHIPKYDRYSVYQVSRYGAPSYPGKRAYMPQYPIERLSNQQLEDLRTYIDASAD